MKFSPWLADLQAQMRELEERLLSVAQAEMAAEGLRAHRFFISPTLSAHRTDYRREDRTDG